MNKKLLLGAALMMGLGSTLTSCVDSTESASVTAVRDAKAEQLKSVADLNKAMAEKELILANANKATQEAQQALSQAQAELLRAQAEYEKAQAELLRAQAAFLNAKTDSEKAKLEMELKKAQAELDKMAQELDEAKAALEYRKSCYEIQLQQLQAQLDLLKIDVAKAQHYYDQMIKAAQKAEDDAEKQAALEAAENVKQLINKYNVASKRLINAKYALAQDQMWLARLESGIENAKNIANEAILALQKENKELEKDLAYYENQLNTYIPYMGTIITQEMWDKALLDLVKSEVAYEAYQPELEAAQDAESDAYEALTTSDYMAGVNETLYDRSGSYQLVNDKLERTEYFFYDIRTYRPDESDDAIPNNCKGTMYLRVGHYISDGMKDTGEDDYENGMVWTYTPVYQTDETSLAKLDNGDKYEIYDTYYNLVDKGAGLKAWLQCKLNGLQNQSDANNLKAAQKEYDDAVAYQKKADEELAKAKTAYTTAESKTKAQQAKAEAARAKVQPAWDAYIEAASKLTAESTDKEKDAVKALETAYTKAQDDAVKEAEALQTLNEDLQEAAIEKAKWIKAVDYATLWVQAATISLNAATNGDASNAALVAHYKELVDGIIAEAANNDANITAYNDAAKVLAEADAKNNELLDANWDAFDIYYDLYMDLIFNNGLIGGNADANDLVIDALNNISAIEAQLDANDQQIASWEAAIEKYDSDEYYNEITIVAQQQIELDQVEVATAQQLFDIAKAELEAATAQK